MADVVIASSEADVQAAEAVERHHAQMAGVLAARVDGMVTALIRSDAQDAVAEREKLAEWCAHELLPHARAEEDTLYPAARRTTEGRLLITGMLADHQLIERLVHRLAAGSDDLIRAVTAASALREVFESHLAKENELVLPLLLRTPQVSVADLLEGMHELLGDDDAETHAAAAGHHVEHACSCGEAEPPGQPELDVRTIPHAIRHATVLGALETVGPGAALVLVASHDPVPLLAEIDQRWPGTFRADYLERGPQTWRLALRRAEA